MDSKRLMQIIRTASKAFAVYATKLDEAGKDVEADQVDKDFADLRRFLGKYVIELEEDDDEG